MKYVFEITGKEMKLTLIDNKISDVNVEIVLNEEYKELISIFTREILINEMNNKLFMRLANHEIEEMIK